MDWTIIFFGAACLAGGVFVGVVGAILLNARDRRVRRVTEAEHALAARWVRENVETRKLREVVTYGDDKRLLAMIVVVEPEGT